MFDPRKKKEIYVLDDFFWHSLITALFTVPGAMPKWKEMYGAESKLLTGLQCADTVCH